MLDVARWLAEQGLGHHAEAFAENSIAGDVLRDLTDADLRELGLNLGDRKRLLRPIAALDGGPAQGQVGKAERAAASAAPRNAERRQLTVMFVDLVGSTALSARLDPEDMREVIRGYQNTVAGEIARFEGHVAKFMGDGVLAYFGWPRGHEDDAERAVRAGAGTVQAVGSMSTPQGQALAARVGIATGLVVVGDLIGEGAAQEEAVVGETPNLAARLQALAEPGQVVIAHNTRRLLGDIFELADLGTTSVKGIGEPVHAFAVAGERHVESRFEARSGHALLPMVGRDQELALLLEYWAQAKAGDSQGVLLVGEAGIGKSRLTRALLDTVAEEPHIRVRYQCSPYYRDSALWPVIQQLTQAAGIVTGDPLDVRLDRLEALLAYTQDSAQAAPLVADLLGLDVTTRYGPLGLTPQVQRARTLAVLVDQLCRVAAQQPVLVVLEDAHWIDPTTLEMIEQALDRIATAPVLILITSRPEPQPALAARPRVTRLILNRLGRGGVEAIVACLGGKSLSAETIAAITARTDGVPLFVEELTKAVLETGQTTVPASLHDSLMARLDRIPEVKEIAQTAACIGRAFDYSLLAAVANRPEPELVSALEKLRTAELVLCRGEPPEANYTFKHALVQDAAYQSLLKSKRRQFHARVAEALEQRSRETGEVEPELLAQHYTGAEFAAEAIANWRKAGARALQRSAHTEASAHLSRGLELLEALPGTRERAQLELELLIPLGQALSVTRGRGSPEVERTYARAWELCRDAGDASQALSVFLGLWGRRFVRAEFQAGQELAEQWSALAERVSDPGALAATAGYMLGGTAYFRGELLLARGHFERALTHYDPRQDGSLAVRYGMYLEPTLACSCWGAETLWLLGHADQALTRSAAALAIAGELKHPPSLASVVAWTALFHSSRREVRKAREHAEATITLAKELGFPFRLAEGKIVRGWALVAAGEMAAGLAELREGIDTWRATGAELSRTWWLALLAEAYERAGQPEPGLAAVADALEMANKTGERLFEAELHRLRGSLLLEWDKTGAVDEAEGCFRQALAVARGQQNRLIELRAATNLARLRGAEGRPAEAYDLLAPVYGWFTEGFDTADLKDAKALLDELPRAGNASALGLDSRARDQQAGYRQHFEM